MDLFRKRKGSAACTAEGCPSQSRFGNAEYMHLDRTSSLTLTQETD